MSSLFTVLIDEELQRSFEIALQLNREEKEFAVTGLMRAYISQTFAKAAATYNAPVTVPVGEDEHYGKAVHRIPKWARKKDQINHKIIRAFLQLEKLGTVTYQALAKYCANPNNEDVFVPTFAQNFAQMKFDGEKSHGKVFEVDDEGVVHIWEVVSPVLEQFRDKFLYHSTDVGFVNDWQQMNMGKTDRKGTDHLQYLYKMHCKICGHDYYANGTDIFLKHCPKCQKGADTKGL